jgi:hypothetical protein
MIRRSDQFPAPDLGDYKGGTASVVAADNAEDQTITFEDYLSNVYAEYVGAALASTTAAPVALFVVNPQYGTNPITHVASSERRRQVRCVPRRLDRLDRAQEPVLRRRVDQPRAGRRKPDLRTVPRRHATIISSGGGGDPATAASLHALPRKHLGNLHLQQLHAQVQTIPTCPITSKRSPRFRRLPLRSDDTLTIRCWPFSLDDHDFGVFRLGPPKRSCSTSRRGSGREWASPNRDQLARAHRHQLGRA